MHKYLAYGWWIWTGQQFAYLTFQQSDTDVQHAHIIMLNYLFFITGGTACWRVAPAAVMCRSSWRACPTSSSSAPSSTPTATSRRCSYVRGSLAASTGELFQESELKYFLFFICDSAQIYTCSLASPRDSVRYRFLNTFPMSDHHEIGRVGVYWKK